MFFPAIMNIDPETIFRTKIYVDHHIHLFHHHMKMLVHELATTMLFVVNLAY